MTDETTAVLSEIIAETQGARDWVSEQLEDENADRQFVAEHAEHALSRIAARLRECLR